MRRTLGWLSCVTRAGGHCRTSASCHSSVSHGDTELTEKSQSGQSCLSRSLPIPSARYPPCLRASVRDNLPNPSSRGSTPSGAKPNWHAPLAGPTAAAHIHLVE